MRGRLWLVLSVGMMALFAVVPARASAGAASETDADDQRAWAIHGQFTNIWQYHPAFRSPYQGPNSLDHGNHVNETTDASLFLGLKLWRGAELWDDSEVNQGIAPSNTLGVAGYVNGDGAKVGKRHPYVRTQRLFLRQTIDLGGGADTVDADQFTFAGKPAHDRLTFTIGKFNVTDIFDDNAYAHDPKRDFLNWSLIDTGSFDYAADAWGLTYGAAVEWRQSAWTLRMGLFDLSKYPNGKSLTPLPRQGQLDLEVERRQTWLGREGKIKLTFFATRGRMGAFDAAVALAAATGRPADTALVRRYGTRMGASLNVEQPVAEDVGVFVRAGLDQGNRESFEYTDIDRTIAAGVSLNGKRWGREGDTFATAVVVNGISAAHQRYTDAGGLGILIGDGRLPHPGAEAILESYYSVGFAKIAHFTVDAQAIEHPAYNRDRGPAVVFSGRLHAEF